jgi:hypothetical protein
VNYTRKYHEAEEDVFSDAVRSIVVNSFEEYLETLQKYSVDPSELFLY